MVCFSFVGWSLTFLTSQVVSHVQQDFGTLSLPERFEQPVSKAIASNGCRHCCRLTWTLACPWQRPAIFARFAERKGLAADMALMSLRVSCGVRRKVLTVTKWWRPLVAGKGGGHSTTLATWGPTSNGRFCSFCEAKWFHSFQSLDIQKHFALTMIGNTGQLHWLLFPLGLYCFFSSACCRPCLAQCHLAQDWNLSYPTLSLWGWNPFRSSLYFASTPKITSLKGLPIICGQQGEVG